jgi:hypothetical protein
MRVLLRLERGQRARRQSKTCLAACSALICPKIERLETKKKAERIVDVEMIPMADEMYIRTKSRQPKAKNKIKPSRLSRHLRSDAEEQELSAGSWQGATALSGRMR